ncbi:MAG: ATP-binding protein [Coleofasciculaceae cyanobacterium]
MVSSLPPESIYSEFSVNRSVEEALWQKVEQERLVNHLSRQIRQSIDLPDILQTTVEEVQFLLKVDRLLIYQVDIDSTSSNGLENTPSPAKTKRPNSFPPSRLGRGCVTYEARASQSIPSVLNLIEEDHCLAERSSCREKYQQGLTVAVDDIEQAYAEFPCLLERLRTVQVRAKLVAPIIVQDRLWGFLIAHKCSRPYSWQNSQETFLQNIAEHLAIAVYQSWLKAQLQQQKTTLEQQVFERTQELRDTLQAAQAANLAKSEFLAAMSHELRTPLTCVIGMSATLLRWSFGGEVGKEIPVNKQRRYLKTIQESGEQLLALINDILDLSQVEAGKAVLNVGEFSLRHLIKQTLNKLKEKAYLQGVSLKMDFRVEPNQDRFCADQHRVKQILYNLLGNAIKFTPEGGKVTLRVWREKNQAVLQVEDTGIGIASDQMPLLFQKFQQLETTYQRNYGGTGLGLALTKQLVELHGGRIEVESVLGEGSFFTVWLPDKAALPPNLAKVKATKKKNFRPKGSIILVEHEEERATLVCEMLTVTGYQVVWLIDGATAVEQIELLRPRAVIVDWQLPGMDGYEISSSLRNLATTRQIKVLALTSPTLSEDEEHCLTLLADDYLHHPVEPMLLLKKITQLVED